MNNGAGLELGILIHSPRYSGSRPWPAVGHMIYDFRAHAQKKKKYFHHPVGAVDETAQLEKPFLGIYLG